MDISSLASLSSAPTSSFPYTQPGLPTLLTALSFLFFLNLLRMIADVTLHAGLVAELFLGMVYGAPLAGILPAEWETAFNVLGYLGLVFIIFEGGLSTNLALLLRNLPLSCFCALTGICTPMALSFALLTAGYGYPPLEAFASGAALSSTSLGTTLAALNSVSKPATSPSADLEVKKRGEEVIEMTGDRGPAPVTNETGSTAHYPRCSAHATISAPPALKQTRIGTVLTSAAIFDDVVGLVIAALIPALANMESLSPSNSGPDLAWTLIRPLLSSLLIALITPAVARFILRPAFWFREVGERWCAPRREDKQWGCSLCGTRWGTESHADFVKVCVMVCVLSGFISVAYYTGSSVLFGAYIAGLTLSYLARPPHDPRAQQEQLVGQADRAAKLSFESAYARTLGPLQEFIFAPIFFASIGYAIPFLLLWRPTILWRGVLYALLMCLGKLAVGLPVVVWSIFTKGTPCRVEEQATPHSQSSSASLPRLSSFRHRLHASMYPAAFIGIAMISRGEIGLLIVQIAQNGPYMGGTSGDAGGLLSEEGFLVCIWAILLCTLVGPICIGLIVRKWRHHITADIWG